jgi:hypothetical protein
MTIKIIRLIGVQTVSEYGWSVEKLAIIGQCHNYDARYMN